MKCPGMGVEIDATQTILGDLRVHLRRCDRGVPQELLDDTYVGTMV